MSPSAVPATTVPSSLDVLIIDDDTLLCERVERLLDNEGIGSLSVSTLSDAWQAMQAVYFPVVVLDRRLGEDDGIELCRQYRQHQAQSRVHILVLSTLDTAHDIKLGLEAGANEYLSKRDGDFVLIEKVKAALDSVRRAF